MASDDLYIEPYATALLQRMQALPDDCFEDSAQESESLKSEMYTNHMSHFISLSRLANEISGITLSGNELFRLPYHVGLTASDWAEKIAKELGVRVQELTIFDEGRPLAEEVVDRFESLVVERAIKEPTVFVCKNVRGTYGELGEATVNKRWLDLESQDMFQAVVNDSVSAKARYPYHYFAEERPVQTWSIYILGKVKQVDADTQGPIKPVGIFPMQPAWSLPTGARQWGDTCCDVWSAIAKLPAILPLLDEHAAHTNDRPIPRYQMIVDPNQFVREVWTANPGALVAQWVPCEFDIRSDGSAQIVGGPRCHAFPQLAEQVATPVLEAALPLLARLRRPQLLLDQRRLQVVFKAQRIIVPPKVNDEAESEYIGIWHMDGHRERIAAVVLYYYKVDATMQGGDMEFCEQGPIDVLGSGDCSNNNWELSASHLRRILLRCRVPISEGTLLVFSNYQMVHRVLRMINTSTEAEASRDFVALFIVDPAAPPLVPSRQHLASPYLMRRSLCASGLWRDPQEKPVSLILEYLGALPSQAYVQSRRCAMLLEQLKPRGRFAGDESAVFSTGNGCFTMIGFFQNMLGGSDHSSFSELNKEGWDRLEALNLAPKQHGRGLSELLSIGTSELGERLQEDLPLEGGGEVVLAGQRV